MARKAISKTLRIWDDAFMRAVCNLVLALPGADHQYFVASTDEGRRTFHALQDKNDSTIRQLWDWLQHAPPGHDSDRATISAAHFMLAVCAASQYELVRKSLRGSSPRLWGTHPSLRLRAIGEHRKGGHQSDFLRLLVASLLEYGIDIDTPGMQTQVLRIGHKILGDSGVGLTPNTVSKIWSEFRDTAKR